MKSFKVIVDRGYRETETKVQGILNLFDFLDGVEQRRQELIPVFKEMGYELKCKIAVEYI